MHKFVRLRQRPRAAATVCNDESQARRHKSDRSVLAQDHEEHGEIARKLFEDSDRGNLVVIILPVVLAESAFVLESFYRRTRVDIAFALSSLISSPGVEIEREAVHLDALDRYRTTQFHFVDCLIAATAAAENTPVATFDQGFRKFPDVRIELR
ncbi:MAG: PIN domain-containing protein [Candidatus Acidiferrales bacterium]